MEITVSRRKMCVGLRLQDSSLLSTVSIALGLDSVVNEDCLSCGQEEGGGVERNSER